MTKQDPSKQCPKCIADTRALDLWIECNHDETVKFSGLPIETKDKIECALYEIANEAKANGVCGSAPISDETYANLGFPFGPIPHWIKCSERLPEVGQAVLIFQQYPKDTLFKADYHPLKNIFMAVAEYRSYGFLNKFSESYKHVIAWMPLPAPPNE